jgi:Tfp pilus assembly PilM family ATPase/Tfp pilus assembly protein PilN
MTDILAIDWEPHRICGVCADVGKSSIRITNSFSLEVSEELQLSPNELGVWLREQLNALRISTRQTYVSLAREDVTVRHLELPIVSDDELPEMVRFQAAAKSTIPLDQLSLDFLPLPTAADADMREVLVASVHQDRLRRLRSVTNAAGLELISVGVSSIASAALVGLSQKGTIDASGDVSLIVARHGGRLEISITSQGYVYLTHSSQSESMAPVLGEISRSMVALQKRLPGARVVRCWLIGSDDEESELSAAIRERFQCDVVRLDPFQAATVKLACTPDQSPHGAFAGPIGQLVREISEAVATVDFLNPRKAAEKRDYRKVKAIAAAAAAVVLFSVMYGYRVLRVSQLEEQITAVKSEDKTQKEFISQYKPKKEVAEAIEEWDASNVDWLQQADALAKTMDGTERFYLTKLQFAEGTRKELGTIAASGNARERFDVESLNAQLTTRHELEVNAKPIKSSGKDGKYPEQFELDVRLKLPEAEAPAPRSGSR